MKTETKHTPWKVQDNRIIQRFYDESWNKQIPASVEDVEIGKFNSCEQAELAARAVNAHESFAWALQAIEARIHGVFDDPALMKLGELGSADEDILRIIAITKSTEGI